MNATLHNTLFLRDEVQKERMVYVEFPSGIYAVKVEDYEKWEELRAQEEDDRSFFEAFILQNKANGKELDPRYFDETERLAFQEADKKEWFSWIKNRVVRRLSDQEAEAIDAPSAAKLLLTTRGTRSEWNSIMLAALSQ